MSADGEEGGEGVSSSPAAAALTAPPGAAQLGPPGGLLRPAVRRFGWLVPPDRPG